MFHKAVRLKYQDGTELEVLFQDGKVIRYDMATLFDKYPELQQLKDRELFLSGKMTLYGITWNDDLDIEMETIYHGGKVVRIEELPVQIMISNSILVARARAGLSQTQLAEATGIDQADISKIERGLTNPSISTLDRIAHALGKKLTIEIK